MEPGAPQIGAGKIRIAEVGTTEISTLQVGTLQICAAQDRLGKIGAGKVRVLENDVAEVSTAPVHADPVGACEVPRPAELRRRASSGSPTARVEAAEEDAQKEGGLLPCTVSHVRPLLPGPPIPLRAREKPTCQMKKLPSRSTATPSDQRIRACVAGPC
jgi:hypothetical protein